MMLQVNHVDVDVDVGSIVTAHKPHVNVAHWRFDSHQTSDFRLRVRLGPFIFCPNSPPFLVETLIHIQ